MHVRSTLWTTTVSSNYCTSLAIPGNPILALLFLHCPSIVALLDACLMHGWGAASVIQEADALMRLTMGLPTSARPGPKHVHKELRGAWGVIWCGLCVCAVHMGIVWAGGTGGSYGGFAYRDCMCDVGCAHCTPFASSPSFLPAHLCCVLPQPLLCPRLSFDGLTPIEHPRPRSALELFTDEVPTAMMDAEEAQSVIDETIIVTSNNLAIDLGRAPALILAHM